MELMIERRDGELEAFDSGKILLAINKAAAGILQQDQEEVVAEVVRGIENEILDRFESFVPNVENLHDIVEKHLMKHGLFDIGKSYILHRADKRRQEAEERKKSSFLRRLMVTKSDGRKVLFNVKKVRQTIDRLSGGLDVKADVVFEEAVRNIFDGVRTEDIEKALVLAATSHIEVDPDYSVLAARVFLQKMKKEVFGKSTEDNSPEIETLYRESFATAINVGVKNKLLDARLLNFDLKVLADKLVLSRDNLFRFMGLQTLYERYFVKLTGHLLELPQTFWMRVAMGLAINEEQKEEKAIEFYEVISQMLYTPSTPTLFHSGLYTPQLASCFLLTADDDLHHIFQTYSDCAQLSKWSGGIGVDWSGIRATLAHINSTKVESQGVIPFLKIANDVTVAINRSGKRRGATCAYLSVWHLDFEDFLDLRKNTGDDRRRTHDMNTACWMSDLFMKRVKENGQWTLFSPDECPDLHELSGQAFEEVYVKYEKKAKAGKIHRFKTMEATKLWRKIITSLFETGHPWLTFTDPANVRNPQDHVGVIHSSNLCTEILLNTKPTKNGILGEVAVCVIGSLNLVRHYRNGVLDKDLLRATVRSAMRILDNVIDLNYYPIPEAKNANVKHRPVGLGFMGFQDLLYELGISYEDAEELADEIQEFIAYEAISASSDLAAERGVYESYNGSKWSRGLFPLDTFDLLEKERGLQIDVPRTTRMNWGDLKDKVRKQGMRNSNTMAVAPTATISTVTGCFPCGEAVFKNLYVKSNMTGEFTVVNEYLVRDLKKLGLWNSEMLDKIKYYDGSVQHIEEIPEEICNRYKEAFEIDPRIAIDHTARRTKWIDQSQSHNLFIRGNDGKTISDVYMYAWEKGLKTTYYLRTMGASGIEKSTLDAAKFGLTQKRNQSEPKLCKINDPTCESCQ